MGKLFKDIMVSFNRNYSILFFLFFIVICYLVMNTGINSDEFDLMVKLEGKNFGSLIIPRAPFKFIATPVEHFTHYIWYPFFRIDSLCTISIFKIIYTILSFYLIKIKKETFSILLFSFAAMTKTWPILFIISFYKKLKNKKIILLVLVFPVISIILYTVLFKSSVINITKTIIGYQGLWGIWGLWSFLGKWRLRWQKLSTLIFLVSSP